MISKAGVQIIMDRSHLVKRLHGDRWESIEVRSLKPNDIFLHAYGARIVTANPILRNGELRVPAKDYSSIAKYCFETEQEATNQAMKCCGSGIVDFGDGTLMITAFPKGDPRIFSPRLSAKRLEEFCKKNSKKYTEFYSNNRDLIDDGYLASMERFW
ncbi:hypothetical protein CRN52_12350 [Vibrio vulnificus]|uniref:Uncharacterized protein n=2 Tax=Vibrionaceae TaxID=641 RepID=A0A2S3R194_VIBVL|nr:hypothetical protein CKJ79_26890 [Vibrio coralliilyticus]POB46863.1 hypothetical protein CRN52_12350 [Vibrio vulnificus]